MDSQIKVMLVLLQHVHEASTFQIFQQRGANIQVMRRCLSFEQKTCQMLAISMNIIGSKFMFHLPLQKLFTHFTHYTLMECQKIPLWAVLYPNLLRQLPNLPEKIPTPRDCSSNMEICVLRILSCSAFTKPAFVFRGRDFRSFELFLFETHHL